MMTDCRRINEEDKSEIMTASLASLDSFATTSAKVKRRRNKSTDKESWIERLFVCDDSEELLLSQRNKRRCRYAELLSQSKSCASRRAYSAVSHTRQLSPQSRLVSAPNTAGMITDEKRSSTVDFIRCPPLPMGSGKLSQMDLLHQRSKCDALLSSCHPSRAAEVYNSSDQRNDDAPATSTDLPAPKLVKYIGFLVQQRCTQLQHRQRQTMLVADGPAIGAVAPLSRNEMKSSTAVAIQQAAPAGDCLCPSIVLDGSALVAVAILVEELTKEFMTSWTSRQLGGGNGSESQGVGVGALLKPSKRRVRVAANLQLTGALSLSTSTTATPKYDDEANRLLSRLLRNRLEVLFAQDLSQYEAAITRMVEEHNNSLSQQQHAHRQQKRHKHQHQHQEVQEEEHQQQQQQQQLQQQQQIDRIHGSGGSCSSRSSSSSSINNNYSSSRSGSSSPKNKRKKLR